MTRKELAMAIAIAEISNKKFENITPARFAHNLLHGCGAMKAQSKTQLENWYNNLYE